jgi:GTP-binding protein
MFVAARGGAGGHGNHFFVSDTQQAPNIAEYGAQGEEMQYVLEVRSMAHIGLVMNQQSTYIENKRTKFISLLRS